MEKKKPTQQYLLIDVGNEEWSVRSFPQERMTELLGGAGVALDLWETYSSKEDSGISAPIVFTGGLLSQLNGSAPSNLTIAALSPLTRRVSISCEMSRFPSLLASCGFHSIVLIGAARRQMTLSIDEQNVHFKASEELIGKSICDSLKILNLTKEQNALLIGPAGEKEIPIASIISDCIPVEREGFAALLGKKRIKGLIVTGGGYTYSAGNPQETQSFLNSFDKAVASGYLSRIAGEEDGMYPLYCAMEKAAASVRHGTGRFDPRMKHFLRTEHPELYTDGARGLTMKTRTGKMFPVSPVHQLAFGANIGNYDPVLAHRFSASAMNAGLDPVSTARIISWCMEASFRGITDEYSLSYGDFSHVEEMIQKIAKGPADSLLCQGSEALSVYHDARQFETSIDGKETLPIDPRGAYGQALVMALGYDFLLPGEFLSPLKGNTESKGKGKEVLRYELLYLLASACGVSSLQMFSLVYKPRSLKGGSERSLSLLGEFISRYLGEEYDDARLKGVALKTLLRYERVSARLSTSATVPLQWLIETSSNVQDESTVPFTKIHEEYLHERELLVASYEEER